MPGHDAQEKYINLIFETINHNSLFFVLKVLKVVKVVKVVKVAKVVKVKVFQVIKTFLVPSFCLTFKHFLCCSLGQ